MLDDLALKFIQERDEDTFRLLYRASSPELYPLCLRLVSFDKDQAEEIMQVFWTSLLEKIDSFQWKSSFKTWAIGIIINISRRYYNQRSYVDVSCVLDLQEGQQNCEELIDLENALASLPEGYREVLILHDIEGYKHREIADLLSISEGTSKSQLFHGRNQLKRILGESGGDND